MATNRSADPQSTIERAGESAQQAIERATEAASRYAEEWLEMKDNWVEGAREYVREHPIAALGMAIAAGYILSMLMRSRD